MANTKTITKKMFENMIGSMLKSYFEDTILSTPKTSDILKKVNLRESKSGNPINIDDIELDVKCSVKLPENVEFPLEYNELSILSLLSKVPVMKKTPSDNNHDLASIMDGLTASGITKITIGEQTEYRYNVLHSNGRDIVQYAFLIGNISQINPKPWLYIKKYILGETTKIRFADTIPVTDDLYNYFILVGTGKTFFNTTEFIDLLKTNTDYVESVFDTWITIGNRHFTKMVKNDEIKYRYLVYKSAKTMEDIKRIQYDFIIKPDYTVRKFQTNFKWVDVTVSVFNNLDNYHKSDPADVVDVTRATYAITEDVFNYIKSVGKGEEQYDEKTFVKLLNKSTDDIETILDTFAVDPIKSLTKIVDNGELNYRFLLYFPYQPIPVGTETLNVSLGEKCFQYDFIVRDCYNANYIDTNFKWIYISKSIPKLALGLQPNDVKDDTEKTYIPISEELFTYIKSVNNNKEKHNNSTFVELINHIFDNEQAKK